MGKRHAARRSAYAITALTLSATLSACGSSSTKADATALKPSQTTSTANVAPPSTTPPATSGATQPSSTSPTQAASPSSTPQQAAPATSAAQPTPTHPSSTPTQDSAQAQINGSPGVPKLSEITQQPQLPGADARSCGTVNFDGAMQPLRVSPQTSCDFARAVVARSMTVGYADHLVAKSPSTNLYYPMRCYGEDGLNSCWGGHGAIVSWGQVIGP